jgi:hypothetical protein
MLGRYRFTGVAVSCAVLVLALAMITNINVFELPALDAIGVENNEVGEVALAFLFIIPALFVDRSAVRQRAHMAEIEAEQLRVVRATMRTVQDIVNNNLNQLQLLRLEAEGCVPDASLSVFDQVIRDTAAELTALANVTTFIERPMEMGSGVAVPGRL